MAKKKRNLVKSHTIPRTTHVYTVPFKRNRKDGNPDQNLKFNNTYYACRYMEARFPDRDWHQLYHKGDDELTPERPTQDYPFMIQSMYAYEINNV